MESMSQQKSDCTKSLKIQAISAWQQSNTEKRTFRNKADVEDNTTWFCDRHRITKIPQKIVSQLKAENSQQMENRSLDANKNSIEFIRKLQTKMEEVYSKLPSFVTKKNTIFSP